MVGGHILPGDTLPTKIVAHQGVEIENIKPGDGVSFPKAGGK
jgi:hypothetical protein